MSALLCVDPGPVLSAWCFVEDGVLLDFGKWPNEMLLEMARCGRGGSCMPLLVIEDIESFGMPVGREVFRTAQWIGRFIEAREDGGEGGNHRLLPRSLVKLTMCGTRKARDANVRQAVIDRVGEPPTKARPNARLPRRPAADEWNALAIALTFQQLREEGREGELETLDSLDRGAGEAQEAH